MTYRDSQSKQYLIGETFKYGTKVLKCHESKGDSCGTVSAKGSVMCHFAHTGSCVVLNLACSNTKRTDEKNVIFLEDIPGSES